MLDNLIGVIETIQNRIQEHGQSLRQNETRTRMALIDPLLQALGWDISDPAFVIPEYPVGGYKADYALLRPDGHPAATVEAKRLGEPLETHLMQMLTYANASGVKYAGITDGDNWALYDVFKQVKLEDKRMLNLNISGTSAPRLALELLLLWRPNLASGEPMKANEPVLAAQQPSPGPQSTNVLQPVTVEPPSTSNEGWTSILNLPPDVSWKSLPSTIRFPNEEERPINSKKWKQVLVEVIEWLISNGGLTKDKCPIGQDSERYIVHTESMQPNGKAFFFPAKLSNGLFVASASTAKKAADDCVFLMKYCGQDPSKVQLKLN